MKRIVMIDHYDSFTYNIVHYLKDFNIKTFYYDKVDWDYLEESSHIILSPGHGHPKDMSNTLAILEKFYAIKPILGICLGHQIIAYFFNSQVGKLSQPYHGKISRVKICYKESALYKDIPQEFNVGRYHSLHVQTLSTDLRKNCISFDGVIMGLEHRVLPIFGLQFHPESILSEYGRDILLNFIKL